MPKGQKQLPRAPGRYSEPLQREVICIARSPERKKLMALTRAIMLKEMEKKNLVLPPAPWVLA